MTSDALLAGAVELVQAGRLADALSMLARDEGVLAPGALQLLAKLRHASGDKAQAVATMRNALAAAPDLPEGWYELGVMLLGSDDVEAAVQAFRRALADVPDHAGAQFNLAWALRRLGLLPEAIEAYGSVVRQDPAHAMAWFNLGNALRDAGRLGEAADAYGHASAVAPGEVAVMANLGATLHELGELDRAESVLRQAIRLDSHRPEVLNALGNLLASKGEFAEAITVLNSLYRMDTGNGKAAANLALAMADAGDLDGGRCVLEEFLDRSDGDGRLFSHLGAILLRSWRPAEAKTVLLRAVELAPDLAEAHNNLGRAYAALGRVDHMIASYRRAHELAPEDAVIHSNLLFALTHDGRIDADLLFTEHRRFGDIQEKLAGPPMDLPPPDTLEGRRLRIGYVSPDFREHAVAIFFEPILSQHDKTRVEIFCYSSRQSGDETSVRLRSYADHWRVIAGLPANRAAAMIRDDRIDVLVDLAGHTSGNALPVFAHRPAPCQVTWLGYPGTTGLTRMDFRLGLGPSFPIPDARSTERIVGLPAAAQFRDPVDAPPVAPPPAADSGIVTFGSMNKKLKANDQVVRVWASILKAVPDSRLVIVVDDSDAPAIRQFFFDEFAAEGVAADRLVLERRRSLNGFLDLLNQVDICLDPFPYGGGTTSLFCFWMGVPIVSLEGADMRQGSSASFLRQLGLADLVAADVEGYVAKACALAHDPARMAALRASLRARMLLSPMMDSRQAARGLENRLEELWRMNVTGD